MDNKIFENIQSVTFLTENFEELTIRSDDVTYTDIHYYDDEDRYVGEVNPHHASREFLHLTIHINNGTKCHWKQFEERDNFDAVKRFERFMDIDGITLFYKDGNHKDLKVYWSGETDDFKRLDHDLYQKHYYEVKDGKLTGDYRLEFVIKDSEQK